MISNAIVEKNQELLIKRINYLVICFLIIPVFDYGYQFAIRKTKIEFLQKDPRKYSSEVKL